MEVGLPHGSENSRARNESSMSVWGKRINRTFAVITSTPVFTRLQAMVIELITPHRKRSHDA